MVPPALSRGAPSVLPNQTKETYTMTWRFPVVDGPTDLPDLRTWLLRTWREGGPLSEVFDDSRYIRRNLQTAQLWWVEPETCDLLAESAPTLPDDALLDFADLPSMSGFAVFAHDLEGIDADPKWSALDHKVRVSAIMWGPATVPGGERGRLVDAISIGSFSRSVLQDGLDQAEMMRAGPTLALLSNDDHLMDGQSIALHGDLFCWLGRSDWMPGLGPNTVHPGDPDLHPHTQASKAEDRRLLGTLWQLAKTPIVGVDTHHPPRAVARRAQREGQDPTVRVLRLGGEAQPRTAGTPSGREWQHSWVVSPHWRWQAHGPGRAQRKLILVGPYRKGPADKPLLGGERVWRVVPPKARS
jgi:hypothetical protein